MIKAALPTVLVLAAMLASCQTTAGPQSFDQILQRPDRPKIALVLGGAMAATGGLVPMWRQVLLDSVTPFTAFAALREGPMPRWDWRNSRTSQATSKVWR